MSHERDPHGRNQHEGGAKLDAGKPTYAMTLGYFSRALAAVNEVSEYGARKYTHGGWRTVPDGEARYTEALLRHALADLGGEERDRDTELLHKAHAAWNALAVLELALQAQHPAGSAGIPVDLDSVVIANVAAFNGDWHGFVRPLADGGEAESRAHTLVVAGHGISPEPAQEAASGVGADCSNESSRQDDAAEEVPVDMSDWRNWQVGDLIKVADQTLLLSVGDVHEIVSLSPTRVYVMADEEGIIGCLPERFRWHARFSGNQVIEPNGQYTGHGGVMIHCPGCDPKTCGCRP